MSVTILKGDALAMLRTLPSESVQVVCTSPPYYGLRDYGVGGQIGLEQTPLAFLEALWDVFDEVRRVLRPDGLCFVNIGDSYAGSGKGPSNSLQRPASCLNDRQLSSGAPPKAWIPIGAGLKAKDLNLIPQRFAIGMQDRGWWVRSEIVWAKTSAMPESVRDRPTSAWEPIWMFAKSARYFYDADAVRQPAATADPMNVSYRANGKSTGRVKHLNGSPGQEPNHGFVTMAVNGERRHESGANLRNVWTLSPEPSREAHFASFPTEIPRRCIKAATSERGQCRECGAPWVRVVEKQTGAENIKPRRIALAETGALHGYEKSSLGHNGHGASTWATVGARSATLGWAPSCQCDAGDPIPQTVLDPFLGSGTTALVADRLGRHCIGIELNPEYAEMARRRIANDAPMVSDGVEVRTPDQLDLFAEAAG